jgi:hypothetical protein
MPNSSELLMWGKTDACARTTGFRLRCLDCISDAAKMISESENGGEEPTDVWMG